MDFKIIVVIFVGVFCSSDGQRYQPVPAGNVVPIVSQTFDLNPDGSYKFSYEAGDGSGREEVGTPNALGSEGPAVSAQGSYKYNSDQGGPVAVNYVANEFGYQPTGDSIHPSIQKAVAFLVSEAQKNPSGSTPGFGGGGAVGGYSGGGGGGLGGFPSGGGGGRVKNFLGRK